MKVQISFALLLAASIISSQDDDGKEARKHYGLSYHSKCIDYVKSFTCMTRCKSMSFQVFRMDFRCKCSCHELKTTTILPFFKWRTNGTTKTLPSTQSPQLYHIAGTLSPARSITERIETTTNASSHTTTVDDGSDSGNATTVKADAETANTTVVSEPESEPDTGAASEPETEVESEIESDKETAVDSEAESAIESEPETKIESEAESSIESELESAIESETESNIDSETESIIESETPE